MKLTNLEFRQKYPFRPDRPALMDGNHVIFPKSYPFEDDDGVVRIFARMVENDACSAEYVEVSRLTVID